MSCSAATDGHRKHTAKRRKHQARRLRHRIGEFYQKYVTAAGVRPSETALGPARDVDVPQRVGRDARALIPTAGAELLGPEERSGRVVLADKCVGAAGVRPAETAVGKARDVDVPQRVGRDAIAIIRTAGAELLGPEECSVRVVLADKCVGAAGIRPAETAPGLARDVDVPQRVGRDAIAIIRTAGAELFGPEECSGLVVLADKCVAAAGVRPAETAPGIARDVDVPQRVGRDPIAIIRTAGAELLGPEECSVRVVLADKCVGAAGVRPAETAAGRARDVDVPQRVGRDALASLIAAGAELFGPEECSGLVVLADKCVGAAGVRPAETAPGIARDVDVPQRVDRDALATFSSAGAELLGPEECSCRVILADKCVVFPGARPAETVGGPARDVDVAQRIGRDAKAIIIAAGAELTYPFDRGSRRVEGAGNHQRKESGQ